MTKRPIVEAMQHFHKSQNISFHVPGHKHGSLSDLPHAFKEVMQFDYTELSGLDDYHHPEGIINEAQALLAKTYGATYSYFLVNGSTVGNLAMVYATCRQGDLVLVQRNAHKSIFHALELVGAQPVFLTPEWDMLTLTPSHVSLKTINRAIEQHPKARALILTHPTYYGVVNLEMSQVIKLAHSRDIPVLVDEAHGAHFVATDDFPKSAIEMGADVVVQSAHKTLPALTMGSFLHIQSTRISNDKVNRYLRMLQSSSPSYLLLASLDDARHYISMYAHEDFLLFNKARINFIVALKMISSLEVIEVDDPLKFILRMSNFTGYTLQKQLEQQGIYVELADPEQVLFILPLLKAEHLFSFDEIHLKVKLAVEACLNEQKDKVAIKYINDDQVLSILAISYEELKEAETEWISYNDSSGRICAGMVIPYPPGIPLFIRGEQITKTKLQMLADYIASGATIQGEHDLSRNQLLVVKEEKT